MKNKLFLTALVFTGIAIGSAAQETGTFTDARDGKEYKTIKIVSQTWMSENLAFKADSGCWAYGNDLGNVAVYGYLYTWNTAMVSCPEGWRLPSNADWRQLTDRLGGESEAGGKLKEAGKTHWEDPNTAATNASGFTALPGGNRAESGTFNSIGYNASWWSTSGNGELKAWYLDVRYSISNATSATEYKKYAFSVRCLKK